MQKTILRQHYAPIVALLLSLSIAVGCKKDGAVPEKVAQPTISSFSPVQGVVGDTISISGSNFGSIPADCSIKFNGIPASIIEITPNLLRAIVPSGQTTGKIAFTVQGKTVVSGNNFTRLAIVSTLAGTGSAGFIDGTGTNASFQYPTDLVLDTLGNVYVTDASNFCIRKITPQGSVTTLAGSGTYGFVDGSGLSARFGTMLGIAINKSNTFLYVADLGNHCIRKVSLTGNVTTISGGPFPGLIDGPASVAKFNVPMGIAVDNAENIYVADAGNNCIRMISSAGEVSTIAGNGTAGYVNGTGLSARFSNPIKVKIKSTGELVVLDQVNHSLRLVSASGVVTTIGGTGVAGFFDGNANTAQFSAPGGLCVDQMDNIYIGDQSNQRVRKLSTTGIVTTVAGSGTIGFLDGAVDIAKFNFPLGLDITPSGLIYVVDNQNQRIRVISN